MRSGATSRSAHRRSAPRAEYDAGRGPTAGGGTENRNPIGSQAITALHVEGVVDESLRDAEGRTVGELAERSGAHPIDAMLDLALADELRTTFQTPPQAYDLDAMRDVANFAYSLPGLSDGGAHTKFSTMGAYPTEFLSELVRDAGIMGLEDAHWRLSAYPAYAAGVRDRGFLREGQPADVVVYDYENLRMRPPEVAHDFPGGEWRRIRKADGYHATIVNGVVTFEGDDCSGATPGRLLRHGRAG